MPSTSDRIEKQIVLDVPRERVWRALTDVREFNEWFRVSLTSPFTPGAVVSGQITCPGYEHLTMTAWVETIEPQRRFAFRWHPSAIEAGVDYSSEPGFDAIPESRRRAAVEGNANGWETQLKNIRAHVEAVTAK